MTQFEGGPDAALRLAVQALADELLCQKAATATILSGDDCVCMSCHAELVREYGLSLRVDDNRAAHARAALTKICTDAEAEFRRGTWGLADEVDQAAQSLGDCSGGFNHG